MSNSDFYNNDNSQDQPQSQSNNSNNPFLQDASNQQQHPNQQSQQHDPDPSAQPQSQYETQTQTQDPSSLSDAQPPPGPPPRRTETFNEFDFVPEHERAQQREVLQSFEADPATGAGPGESQADRDVAQLQKEFPGLDGAVVAAIYGDSGQVGAAREVLGELSGAV